MSQPQQLQEVRQNNSGKTVSKMAELDIPNGSAVKYSWVARDVTKNQTKKLLILLSFYFHEVLQYLNIFT